MKGKIIANWHDIEYDKKTRLPVKKDQAKILAALQYFMTSPEKHKTEIRNAIVKAQEFGSSADFPTTVLAVLEKFHVTAHFDVAYQEIFDIRDFTGSDRNGFALTDVVSGLTFAKTKEGEKLTVNEMSGTKTQVFFDVYGGAIGWSRTLIQDKEYWTLEDNAIAFRNKSMEAEASAYYALIEAVTSARNITWQAPDPAALPNTDATYTANRDAQTINAAVLNIIDAVKDKGYGINPNNQTFIILCPIALKTRLRKALSVVLQAFAGSENQVGWNFNLLTTTMLTSNTQYYVILPKIKAKGGTRMDLEIFTQFDILSFTDTSAGWKRFGGAIGDQEQFARCLIS